MKGVSHASKYTRNSVGEREWGGPHPTPFINIVTRTNLLRSSVSNRQGSITSAHVRDLMACHGANRLGTTVNLEKMAIEIPINETSNGLVKPPQVTFVCYPARVRLID